MTIWTDCDGDKVEIGHDGKSGAGEHYLTAIDRDGGRTSVYLSEEMRRGMAAALLEGLSTEPSVRAQFPMPREVFSFLLSNRYGNATESEAYSALAAFFEVHYGYIYP